MKPLGHNNLSAFGYVLLIILFCIPGIGTPALIICALFARDPGAKNFARALILITIICAALIVVGYFLGVVDIETYYEYTNDAVEVFRGVVPAFA